MIHTVWKTSSTNSLAREMTLGHGDAVRAVVQTAGRGQRGNSWEAEPEANLTISVMLRPDALEASRQFVVSLVSALAVAGLVTDCLTLDAVDLPVTVKWPNDVYVADRKIAGILIENSVTAARVASSIVGIGININQKVFVSDAPNPVSLVNLTGHLYNIEELAEQLVERIIGWMDIASSGEEGIKLIDSAYRSLLYRRKGTHRWKDAPSGEIFSASIEGIDAFGRLLLLREGEIEPVAYEFKQVVYI